MVRHVLQLWAHRAQRPAARACSATVRTAAASVLDKKMWPWPWTPCSRRGIRVPQSLAHHRRHRATSSEACSTCCTAPRRRPSAALPPYAALMCHLHINPRTIVPEIRASGQRSSCGHTCGMRPGAAELPRSKRASSWSVVHAASCMAPLHQAKPRALRLFRLSGKKMLTRATRCRRRERRRHAWLSGCAASSRGLLIRHLLTQLLTSRTTYVKR